MTNRSTNRFEATGTSTTRLKIALPSWLSSVAVHALLLFLFATSLKSCQRDASSGEGGDFREVGIYLKQPAPLEQQEENSPSEPDPTSPANSGPVSPFSEPALDRLPVTPPVELTLPDASTRVLAPGGASPVSVPGDLQELLKPNGFVGTSPSAGLSPGETSFIGIKDNATRFVYVIDASGSMSDYHAIRAAKNELLASLESLLGTQQFQIILYNRQAFVMPRLRGGGPPELMWASDVHRTLARQWLDGIQPDGGTDHLPALKMALGFRSEVLYFLTDAQQPQLTAGQLAEIQKYNNGRTRIHCIEFGKGPPLSSPNFLNFLQKLAVQNDGQYRYVDVTRLNLR